MRLGDERVILYQSIPTKEEMRDNQKKTIHQIQDINEKIENFILQHIIGIKQSICPNQPKESISRKKTKINDI